MAMATFPCVPEVKINLLLIAFEELSEISIPAQRTWVVCPAVPASPG